ncbi:VanZ family protein [Agromyces binzhouensis]|uniref:VanZ family protein n=2 Tax=Agromyces binzhouensis TaxID=1817495 RepID=A0A4Q2JND2_9MICO|nr:VanZ family protein [Agromyces binzhouensis]
MRKDLAKRPIRLPPDAQEGQRLARDDRGMRPSRTAAVLLFAYAVVMMWVTLGPAPGAVSGNQATRGILDPRIWFDSDTWTIGSQTEFELNVLLFVPFGALLAFALRGAPAIVPAVMSAGFALLIEVAQIPMADRISDPRDLVANTLGAVIGILIARISDAIASIPAALKARRRAAYAREATRTSPLQATRTATGGVRITPDDRARSRAPADRG